MNLEKIVSAVRSEALNHWMFGSANCEAGKHLEKLLNEFHKSHPRYTFEAESIHIPVKAEGLDDLPGQPHMILDVFVVESKNVKKSRCGLFARDLYAFLREKNEDVSNSFGKKQGFDIVAWETKVNFKEFTGDLPIQYRLLIHFLTFKQFEDYKKKNLQPR